MSPRAHPAPGDRARERVLRARRRETDRMPSTSRSASAGRPRAASARRGAAGTRARSAPNRFARVAERREAQRRRRVAGVHRRRRGAERERRRSLPAQGAALQRLARDRPPVLGLGALRELGPRSAAALSGGRSLSAFQPSAGEPHVISRLGERAARAATSTRRREKDLAHLLPRRRRRRRQRVRRGLLEIVGRDERASRHACADSTHCPCAARACAISSCKSLRRAERLLARASTLSAAANDSSGAAGARTRDTGAASFGACSHPRRRTRAAPRRRARAIAASQLHRAIRLLARDRRR